MVTKVTGNRVKEMSLVLFLSKWQALIELPSIKDQLAEKHQHGTYAKKHQEKKPTIDKR